MILQVGVKAFIQNREGKYLLLLRAAPYEGGTRCKWDIPGGRINTDEPIVDALAREIKEETSLQMWRQPQLIFAQDIFHGEKHVVRLTYTAKATGEVILDKNEHTEFGWFSMLEIKKLYHDIYLTPVLKLL